MTLSDKMSVEGWQRRTPMDAREFVRTVHMLGMTIAAAGRFLDVSERTPTRYAHGKTAVPMPVAMLLRAMLAMKIRPVVPSRKRGARKRATDTFRAGNAPVSRPPPTTP